MRRALIACLLLLAVVFTAGYAVASGWRVTAAVLCTVSVIVVLLIVLAARGE